MRVYEDSMPGPRPFSMPPLPVPIDSSVSPVAPVDRLIQLTKADHQVNPPDLLRRLDAAIRAQEGLQPLPPHSDPLNSLFDRSLTAKHRRFIAVCLLRLLGVRSFFDHGELRQKAIGLFDDVFANDIYRSLGITVKHQTFEKLVRLEGLASQAELELKLDIESWSSLAVVSNFRQRFMARFNNSLTKAIVWPFLPKQLTSARLDEVFAVAIDYLRETGTGLLQALEKLRDTVITFRTEAQQFGTRYSIDFLAAVADKLLAFCEIHFADNPISKPATITIEKSEKKYPLHLPGQAIRLAVLVRNTGPGHAFDVFVRLTEATDVTIARHETYMGHLEQASVGLEIPGTVAVACSSTLISVVVQWRNYDGTGGESEFTFELAGQRSDVPWEQLARQEPYSTEPVSTEAELIGRQDILNDLLARAQASSVGSSYVFGQKRVGKTSLVQTLKTELNKIYPRNYAVVFLEGGDYVHPDPTRTVEGLGRRLCMELQQMDARLSYITIPEFQGALSPISEFLSAVIRVAPDLRVLIILDEFSELPLDLYKRGTVGDAFFLTLRSISGKPAFGFIIVGGEKMELILSCQGEALNKFQAVRIDYFDKEKHWPDFQSLVRRPVEDWLEISDEALITLYDLTAGNPYFTKLICGTIVKLMLDRRDSHVTSYEVEESTRISLQRAGSKSFAHYWDDGIFAGGERKEEISILRRKILLGFADVLRAGMHPTLEAIAEGAAKYGVSPATVSLEIRELERREVFVKKEDSYGCKVHFFQRWLQEIGVKEIITTFADIDSVLARRKEEEEALIRPEEIVKVTEAWGTYKGRHITEDRVRAWLRQFGDNSSQRLMFRLLQNLTFYTGGNIRSKMRDANGIVHRDLMWHLAPGRQKRSDIVVSYLGATGKSGAYYARIFADENQIYYENVIESAHVSLFIKQHVDVKAIVFIDDFLGTGKSVSGQLSAFLEKNGKALEDRQVGTSFVAICGFQVAQAKIESAIGAFGNRVVVHICDPLDDTHRCFSSDSGIFPEVSERERARDIAVRYGERLLKSNPLGYSGSQAAVVFENSCPNNSLPILWAEGKDWSPLFKRF